MASREQEMKQYALDMITQMEQFLRAHFKDKDFVIGKRIVSLDKRRKRSWGGSRPRTWDSKERENLAILNLFDVGYINIALKRFTATRGTYSHSFIEYDSIFKRKDIGTTFGHWKRCIGALVAHEVAHAYVSCCGSNILVNGSFVPNETMDKGHSKQWQYVYHLLREKFVNPYQEGYPLNNQE